MAFMNKAKLLLLFLLVGICSCNKVKEQEIILDDNMQNSEDSIAMSSFIKVEKTIKLENSPSSLIGNIHQIIKKNGLYYINSSNSPLKVFDENGRYVRNIGDLGHARGEYASVLSMDIDENNVYVLTSRKLMTYSINGTFLEAHDLDVNADAIHVYDDGYLFFVLEDKNVLHTYTKSLVPQKQNIPRKQALRISRYMPFCSLGDKLLFHEGHSSDVAVFNTTSNTFSSAKLLGSDNCLTIEEEDGLIEKGVKVHKSSKRIFDGMITTEHQLLVASMYNQEMLIYAKDFRTNKTISFPIERIVNDLTFVSPLSFFASNTYSKENFITYISPMLLSEAKQKEGDAVAKSPCADLILPLMGDENSNSNPIIIEYSLILR